MSSRCTRHGKKIDVTNENVRIPNSYADVPLHNLITTRSPLQQLAEGLYPARSAMDLQAASL